jgi:fucose 4-O-acetylase-like acetyltransferase
MHKERNYNIDVAKALAMVLVVMQHAWSMLDLDNPEFGLVCSAYRAIVTVGVPLSFFYQEPYCCHNQ